MLQIAAEEFALNGFHDTKISNIVKRAGLTQPAFYLYFSSKDAIYQELIDQFTYKLEELVGISRLESNVTFDTLAERIGVGLGAIFTFFEQNEYLAKIAFIHSDNSSEIKEKLAAQIAENLRIEQRYSYFRSDVDVMIAAQLVISALERLSLAYLWTGEKTAKEITNETVQIILNGLIKKR